MLRKYVPWMLAAALAGGCGDDAGGGPSAPKRPLAAVAADLEVRFGEDDTNMPGEAPAGSFSTGEGKLWVTHREERTLTRIDPETGRKLRTVRTPPLGRDSYGVVVGDILWYASDDELRAVDAETGEPLRKPLRMKIYANALVHAFGSLWVGAADDGVVERRDARTGKVLARITVSAESRLGGLAAGRDHLWVVDQSRNAISRVDPATNEVVGQPLSFGTFVPHYGIAMARGSVWLASQDGRLLRLDERSGRKTAEIPVEAGYIEVFAVDDQVWLGRPGANSVIRIDPLTNRPATRPAAIGFQLFAVDGRIWTLDVNAPVVRRVAPR